MLNYIITSTHCIIILYRILAMLGFMLIRYQPATLVDLPKNEVSIETNKYKLCHILKSHQLVRQVRQGLKLQHYRLTE